MRFVYIRLISDARSKQTDVCKLVMSISYGYGSVHAFSSSIYQYYERDI